MLVKYDVPLPASDCSPVVTMPMRTFGFSFLKHAPPLSPGRAWAGIPPSGLGGAAAPKTTFPFSYLRISVTLFSPDRRMPYESAVPAGPYPTMTKPSPISTSESVRTMGGEANDTGRPRRMAARSALFQNTDDC